ncbi:jmjC-domain-containing protein [Moesziomyces antarcticus]|uniref:[histone H3]-trimethyl-L-lysine(9) demethylase n=2 Tax=Pseudozyma antarctica TaxID=84753 RepID=A0A081CKF6_PSEA2|nr:jmjC-domain-containing protein [Moesziomyces antarcticus]GAK67152.1 jmjC-domain-containing protein [Moesziomyces antarcticus]SPO48407.1 related to RPH1 - Transcriptional repressor of PHR1 [Moesziomyces antarcticus]
MSVVEPATATISTTPASSTQPLPTDIDTTTTNTTAPSAPSASASSPSDAHSPILAPNGSSRQSTPATSAAASDHAHAAPIKRASTPANTDPRPATPPPPSHDDKHPLADIQPAYFYPTDASASSSHDGIPVFEPTMQQFQDFYAFCQAIDSWGMQSGIVKVVPPKEWRDALPDLRPPSTATATADSDPADISKVRIRNAISQHFTPAGSGVWRQTNITRTTKIWNAKQWAESCIQDGQKGPEMDRMKWKVEVEGVSNGGWGPKSIGAKDSAPAAILDEDGVRTRSGKARPAPTTPAEPRSNPPKRKRPDTQDPIQSQEPTSAPSSPERRSLRTAHNASAANQSAANTPSTSRDASPVKPKKNWEADAVTPQEWRAFDYKNCWLKEALSSDQLATLNAASSPPSQPVEEAEKTSAPTLPSPSDWTPEVCREIESEYWRSLNFGKPPMYGADLRGTLFDDNTQHWNVGKLDNILTRLRLKRKLPGVNTPYLYWGMWRATFAWHVEDMDLYSINYIHFGAPKQWYAIRQADRQRFESAMAGAFPSDSRRCPHFMRHKSYLASPSFLASHGIRPLKLVHNAGEFVITYPYGYHSGFNLGYNCAESVNFALDSWLDIGRKANYCHCDQSQNSVRIDVDAMLEESKEMEELERKRELRRAKEDSVRAIEDEELEKRRLKNEKAKERRKLKKEADDAAAAAAGPAVPALFQGGDDFYIDPKTAHTSPCVFCPANVSNDLVPTPAHIDSTNAKLKAMAARHAHRLCASFIPETWVGKHAKADVVCGIDGIDKARFSLKCQICPNPNLQKLYPKIQCTRGKCPRAAHVSCALVEDHGWFVDLCPTDTADRLEGKKVSAKPQAQQAQGTADDSERLVVLCRTHNPLFREAEEARKADELRERIHSLPVPSMVKIKTSGGMFQALMVEVCEDDDEIVIEDEGRPSRVKFQQIILESSEPSAVKTEPEPEPTPDAVSQGVGAAAQDGDATPSAKRRRKATAKAVANARAGSEDAVEASVAVSSDAAPKAQPVKRARNTKAQKAASSAEGVEPQQPAESAASLAPEAESGPAAKPKRKRQPAKKKAQATQAAADESAPAVLQAPQPPVPGTAWSSHAPQLPAPPTHQRDPRDPRATYAPQAAGPYYPGAYHEQQSHPSSGPMQHVQHYPGMYGGGPPHASHAHQYVPGAAYGYPSAEYDAEATRYSRSSVSASPSHLHQRAANEHAYSGQQQYAAQQQHAAPPRHRQDEQHAQYPYAHPQNGAAGMPQQQQARPLAPPGASQYGHLAAPPQGYEDRPPPLPTYARPLAHQPQHVASSDAASANGPAHAFPDYRPPYHHAAPAQTHPAYHGQSQAQAQQYQQYRSYPPQQQQQQHPQQHPQQQAYAHADYAYHATHPGYAARAKYAPAQGNAYAQQPQYAHAQAHANAQEQLAGAHAQPAARH